MPRAWSPTGTQTQHGRRRPNPIRQCQQQHRSTGRCRRQTEPARGRQTGFLQHPDGKRQGPRPHALLEAPQNIGFTRGLDGNHRLGRQAKAGETCPIEPSMLRLESNRSTPEDGASLARVLCLEGTAAARRETSRQSECSRPVAVGRRLDFMQRRRVQASPRKFRIECRLAECPAARIGAGKWHLSGWKGRNRRGGDRLGTRAHSRGQASLFRAAGHMGNHTGQLGACNRRSPTFDDMDPGLQFVDQQPSGLIPGGRSRRSGQPGVWQAIRSAAARGRTRYATRTRRNRRNRRNRLTRHTSLHHRLGNTPWGRGGYRARTHEDPRRQTAWDGGVGDHLAHGNALRELEPMGGPCGPGEFFFCSRREPMARQEISRTKREQFLAAFTQRPIPGRHPLIEPALLRACIDCARHKSRH